MPIYDVRCPADHLSEVYVHASDKLTPCPTCQQPTERIWTTHAVIGDEIDETHEDLDPGGGVIRFRSRQAKQRYLDAHNLMPFVRHTPGDKHVRSWAIMDPYTLEAATALVSRAGSAADPAVRCETAVFTTRLIKELPRD